MTPVQLSQNVLRQLQVTGWADLAAVLDRVAKTATEIQIVSAKNDNRLLLSKTVLRQIENGPWSRTHIQMILTQCSLMRPYGDMNLGQHCFQQRPVA